MMILVISTKNTLDHQEELLQLKCRTPQTRIKGLILVQTSDEEEEARDPDAVTNDFTSREAKVWEAKSKATERIWKKRKEEELICKICGELGRFTQGFPSTLGANRKSQDFIERVPARDPQVRSPVSTCYPTHLICPSCHLNFSAIRGSYAFCFLI